MQQSASFSPISVPCGFLKLSLFGLQLYLFVGGYLFVVGRPLPVVDVFSRYVPAPCQPHRRMCNAFETSSNPRLQKSRRRGNPKSEESLLMFD